MPNEYDRIIKENIEAVILPLSDKLFGIRPEAMEEITVDLHLTLERKPDVTRRITDEQGRKSILHIEFQVSDETEMVLADANLPGAVARGSPTAGSAVCRLPGTEEAYYEDQGLGADSR